MFRNAQVPDVTPRSRNSGLIPSDVPRWIIRMCCGRYDIYTNIPTRLIGGGRCIGQRRTYEDSKEYDERED